MVLRIRIEIRALRRRMLCSLSVFLCSHVSSTAAGVAAGTRCPKRSSLSARSYLIDLCNHKLHTADAPSPSSNRNAPWPGLFCDTQDPCRATWATAAPAARKKRKAKKEQCVSPTCSLQSCHGRLQPGRPRCEPSIPRYCMWLAHHSSLI